MSYDTEYDINDLQLMCQFFCLMWGDKSNCLEVNSGESICLSGLLSLL